MVTLVCKLNKFSYNIATLAMAHQAPTSCVHCCLHERYSTKGMSFVLANEKNRNAHKLFCKFVNSSFAFQLGKNIFKKRL